MNLEVEVIDVEVGYPKDTDPDDNDNDDDDAKWQKLTGYIEDWGEPEDGSWSKFFVKGLDGKFLETDDTSLHIGENNRAFIHKTKRSDSPYKAFVHDTYLGGTLSFDVDLRDVPCQCSTGVFLTYLDDEHCHYHAPQCDRIAIMEANTYGFITNHKKCASGICSEPK